MTPRVLASTTSHKREPLLPTLDVFSRLGLRDLDLNLHHFIEGSASADAVAAAVDVGGQRVHVVSGGWCDFFDGPPKSEDTVRSVVRQVQIAKRLNAPMLRLFFGRRSREAYDQATAAAIVDNLRQLSDRHPDIIFIFENHDGASLVPGICRDVLVRVARRNIRMNFDPINFARVGIDPSEALAELQPFVAHLHLKGLEHGDYCEFGTGDVDLTPVLRTLLQQGYAGDFTVEYEGPFDGTVRLYESIVRARAVTAALTGPQ